MFPSAMFFIVVGVFSTDNSLIQIAEVLAFIITAAAEGHPTGGR